MELHDYKHGGSVFLRWYVNTHSWERENRRRNRNNQHGGDNVGYGFHKCSINHPALLSPAPGDGGVQTVEPLTCIHLTDMEVAFGAEAP